MEKAILKTLIYADIFNYPLKIKEIHKWLIGRKVTIRQVEKMLNKLNQESRISSHGGYYFLRRRDGVITQRCRREKQSASYLRKAKLISQVLKMIPWIKLVGISGGLAMGNAGKTDDIDLFIIIGKNRLWMSRILALGIISLLGQRRKKGEKGRKIAGKLCINILLEEDRLEQRNKDIFVAHEVLQMKVLWQRDGIYAKYLEDNEWAFRLLPNWIANSNQDLRFKNYDLRIKNHKSLIINRKSDFDYIENLAKKLQLKIMKQPQGLERIEDGALYFHPNDCRLKVLSKYRQKLKTVISP